MKEWYFDFDNLWRKNPDKMGAAFVFIPFMIGVCDWMISIVFMNLAFTWRTK